MSKAPPKPRTKRHKLLSSLALLADGSATTYEDLVALETQAVADGRPLLTAEELQALTIISVNARKAADVTMELLLKANNEKQGG